MKVFKDIPHDIQAVVFSQNCLSYARTYTAQKDPVFNILAEALYQTANAHYKVLLRDMEDK